MIIIFVQGVSSTLMRKVDAAGKIRRLSGLKMLTLLIEVGERGLNNTELDGLLFLLHLLDSINIFRIDRNQILPTGCIFV